MDLIERVAYFALGGVLGYILGFIVGRLRKIGADVYDIKKEFEAVKNKLTKNRGEDGIMSHRWSANLALIIVVLMTMYAALLSQGASNRSNETADRILDLQTSQKQNLDCTTQVLFDAVSALNERTTYTGAQLNANLRLVQGQLEFLNSLATEPPLTEEQELANYFEYVRQVKRFVRLAEQTQVQQNQNPYPTVEDLTSCLAQTPAETQEPSHE